MLGCSSGPTMQNGATANPTNTDNVAGWTARGLGRPDATQGGGFNSSAASNLFNQWAAPFSVPRFDNAGGISGVNAFGGLNPALQTGQFGSSGWNSPIGFVTHSATPPFLNGFGSVNTLGMNAAPHFGANFDTPFANTGARPYSHTTTPFFRGGDVPMNSLFNGFNAFNGFFPMQGGGHAWATPFSGMNARTGSEQFSPGRQPIINIWEKDDSYRIQIEVPGVSLDDIELQLAGRTLFVKTGRVIDRGADDGRLVYSERPLSPFVRAIPLPGEIDVQNVDAKLVNGVLELVLVKAGLEQRRTIRVSPSATV